MSKEVLHIWHTTATDTPGNGDIEYECRHLAMCEEGAQQAFLVHYGMIGFNGEWNTVDEGTITIETDRSKICFDSLCLMYALRLNKDETE